MRVAIFNIKRWLFWLVLLALVAISASAQDVMELMSGTKIEGQVKSIDKEKKLVTFSARIGGQTVERTYPYSRIHAVTYQGQRYVLTEKVATPAGAPSSTPGGGSTGSGPPRRSAAEVKALIEQSGKTPPDWFDQVPVEHPPTLDLDWPIKPEGNWNNQKNVGQYLWDIINPNPNRWRSGVRLVHHLLVLHNADAQKRNRSMKTLGSMYFNLLQDYARAAYWWQQAGVGSQDPDVMGLAECYWRLGDRKSAEGLLVDPDRPKANNTLHSGMIKLWGDMGEPEKAVKLAEWFVRAGGQPQLSYLLAADACRVAGRYDDAIRYYQKTLDAPGDGKEGKIDQTRQRARDSQAAIKLIELLDVTKVADGKYRNSSRGYEGPLEVEVGVSNGRIDSVRVTQHREKQFYSALTDIPSQIIAKQGVKGVDATSRATITAEAIINATAKALANQQ